MKLPFLGKKPDYNAMTEDELSDGIARSDRFLDKRPAVSQFLANTAYIVTAAALMAVGFATGTITLGVVIGGLGIGAGYTFGGAYAYKFAFINTLRERNAMTDIYNAKMTARVTAETEAANEAERLRRIKAAEDFNAAVDAGLPLEADIKIKKALKLKRKAPPEMHGFARIKDIFDPRF